MHVINAVAFNQVKSTSANRIVYVYIFETNKVLDPRKFLATQASEAY